MIQIVEFKERYGRNDNAIHGANKWLEEHREYRIIDIKLPPQRQRSGICRMQDAAPEVS